MENNVKQYDEHIKVTKEVTDEDIQRWKKLDELECSIHEVPKKKHRVGMKFWRIFGNTTGQIVLSILAILWVIPLFYLIVQSFRKEPLRDFYLRDTRFSLKIFSFNLNFCIFPEAVKGMF